MRTPAPRRKAAKVVTTSLLAMLLLALMSVGFVAGSAAASPSKAKPKSTTTTTKKTTTTKATTTKKTPTTTLESPDAIPRTPADHYFVLYGTANAASDHEILGSSAFPNYTHGAVDNYYAMAHSHVDNSPFAEGTASPADTGPVGQTAAAGNFQQPQYADARWPGDPGKAAYGTKGQPYATAEASDYHATAEASEASNALNGPSAPSTMAVPKGFDGRLRLALAGWKATWQNRPGPKVPVGKGTVKGTVKGTAKPTVPAVTTPVATVTTPTPSVGGLKSAPPVPAPPAPTPPVTMPLPTVPSTSARRTGTTSRSLAASSSPSSSSSSSSGDGESLLESSSMTTLDPKTNALVTTGESRLGRVSLGGGQIVIEGIHVSATITNDGTPTYKASVSVASATIGGVPVTIDEDGVHVAGQGQGAPYKQASDALNGALKQAGIQLFLVGPEVTTNSCAATGDSNGGSSGNSGNSGSNNNNNNNTTTSNDQGGTTPTANSCDQSGMTGSCGTGTGTGTGTTTTTTSPTPSPTPTTTTSTDQTSTNSTTSSCDQGSSCPQTSATTGMTTTNTTTTTTNTTTTTTSSNQTSTTPTASWCDQSGMTTPTSSCLKNGKTTTTSSIDQTATTTDSTTTTTSSDQGSTSPDGTSSGQGEQTVRATGVHVVFTQPVGQSGVPAQYAEHILGEVFLDSLAVPAGPLPKLDLNLNFSSSSSSCLNGVAGKSKTSGLAAAGGSSSVGGSTSSSSLSPSASGFASGSGSSSAGGGMPTSLAELASLMRSKPMWLLLAYLVWQTLAVVTGVSLWNWRRGEVT